MSLSEAKGECCEARSGGNFRQKIDRRKIPSPAQKTKTTFDEGWFFDRMKVRLCYGKKCFNNKKGGPGA